MQVRGFVKTPVALSVMLTHDTSPKGRGKNTHRVCGSHGEKHPPLRRHPLYERGQGLEIIGRYAQGCVPWI